jgi:hypothetical protein
MYTYFTPESAECSTPESTQNGLKTQTEGLKHRRKHRGDASWHWSWH